MDVERELISKIILTQDMRPVLDAHIKPDFFVGELNRMTFEWVLDFWTNHQSVPTMKTLKREIPEFKVLRVPEPYSYYVEELQDARRYGLLHDSVLDARAFLEQRDSQGALDSLVAGIQLVASEVSSTRDVNLAENVDERIKEYKALKDLPGGMRGIPTGFPTLDRAMSGLQPEQLITIVAPPKHGKSTILLSMAKSVRTYGRKPLFIGFEMSNEEQAMRYDALVAGVSYTRLSTGTLTPVEEKRLFKAMEQRAAFPDFWMSADAAGVSTVSGIAGKIEQYRPDVAFVDGVYMMQDDLGEDPGTSRALTNITRAMKRLCQRVRIPIVCTTQVLPSRYNERIGITINSIGYTSSFAQDSDVVIGVEKQEDDQAKVSVLAGRSCPQVSSILHWDWDTGTLEEMESEEAEDDSIPSHSL